MHDVHGLVDNFLAKRGKFVDKSLPKTLPGPIWFVVPEGAGGNQAGAASDRRTGSRDCRRLDRKDGMADWAGADRKVVQVVPRPPRR